MKLFEENELNKKKDLQYLQSEQIDIIIKYIDLSDKELKRENIKQSYKDEDNEELRYCLRSILQYIPWVRKIYILMPNEKVKYLKTVDEINEKILYIKDKDLLGFESANIQSFLFNLYKVEKFGVSKNFIYMEDDYFFGKKISKNQFFYYDFNQKKIVPYVISNKFYYINKTDVLNNYYELFKRKETINPHSYEGFRHQIFNTDKFLLEHYNISFIEAKFTHNAIPENIDDLKHIYNESNKYEYNNATLLSKQRDVLSLCHQHLLNLYFLNIKNRKVNFIHTWYIPIEKIKKYNLNKLLFVLNTGGNHKPLRRQYKIQKKIMKKRFPFQSIYEINKKYININNEIYPLIIKKYIILFLLKILYNNLYFKRN